MTDGTNDFPGNLSRASEPATGHLDAVDFLAGLVRKPGGSGARIPQGFPLIVEGWALAPGGDRGADDVVVTVGSGVAVNARAGFARPDVAGAFRRAGVYGAGFGATVPTGALEPGSYDVNFHVIDRAHGAYSSWHARTTIQICARGDTQPLQGHGRMLTAIESVTTEPARAGDDGRRIPENAVVLVEGWLVDTVAEAPAGEVGVMVDDVVVHRAPYGYESDAAARRFGPAARACGFKARFSTRNLPAGMHAFRIVAVSADGSAFDGGEEQPFELLRGPVAGVRGTLTAQQTPAQFERIFQLGPQGIAPVLGAVRVERGENLYFSGWAIDEPNAGAGFDALLLVDDALLFDASYGAPRADVAERFGSARFLACGFVGAVATDELEPGAHTVRCLVRSSTDAAWRVGSDRVEFDVI
jgi:hypothetical protein